MSKNSISIPGVNFFHRVAKYIFDDRPTEEIAEIAVQGLAEGVESPSLIMLAGMDKSQSPFLIDDYFSKLLEELELTSLSNKKLAAAFMAKSIAFSIIENRIDAYEGCNTLFRELVDFLDFGEKDKVYDGIGLEKIYGEYDTIEELQNATHSWSSTKTNEQLIEESKQRIKSLLVSWLTVGWKRNG